MIRVERTAPPAYIDTAAFRDLKVQYEQFRAAGGTRVMQRRLDPAEFLSEVAAQVDRDLRALFHSKCAYTEVRDETLRFHLHRPETDAYDPRLGQSPEHYWWTAMWWHNWYLASSQITSLTRDLFPVIGDRAPAPDAATVAAADFSVKPDWLDQGVLLDPCEDRPEWYLQFDSDGRVTARRDIWPHDHDQARRGEETIRHLDLNAKDLIASRAHAIAEALHPPSAVPSNTLDLADLAWNSPERQHIGAIRQARVLRWLEPLRWAGTQEPYHRPSGPYPTRVPNLQVRVGSQPPSWDTVRPLLPELAPHVAADPHLFTRSLVEKVVSYVDGFDPELAIRIERARIAREPMLADTPLRADSPRRTPVAEAPPTPVVESTAMIRRIKVKNFKAIDEVDLALPIEEVTLEVGDDIETKVEGRRWKALLGENGSGKSSLLQAVGLALAADSIDELERREGFDWSRMLRRGARQGRVLIELTGDVAIDLRFNHRKSWFVGAVPAMDGFVRGFGATRLIGPDAGDPSANVRLENLYDPRASVIDAERWLRDLSDEGDFNVAAVAIADLLGMHEAVTEGLTVEPTRRFLQRSDDELTLDGEPLSNLSDGYRSVVAMACDLLAGASEGLSEARSAHGIVLIDEIGAHLHPRWKMRITRALRRVFPSMQFIVTTHEPLCLLGLQDNEVILVTSDRSDASQQRHAEFQQIAESPSNYRVDRLLTSEFFGLHTTVDPILDRQFQRYYALLALDDSDRSPADEEWLAEFRPTMSRHAVLGYTRRDQLVYEAIDQFLATADRDPARRRAQRDATFATIRDIWQNVVDTRAGRTP